VKKIKKKKKGQTKMLRKVLESNPLSRKIFTKGKTLKSEFFGGEQGWGPC